VQSIFIFANQFPQVFAAGAIQALTNLRVHKRLEGIGQGNVHGAHAHSLDVMAKFGKIKIDVLSKTD